MRPSCSIFQSALAIRHHDDAGRRHAGFERQLLLGTAPRRADLGVRIVGDVLVALKSERVAFLQREGLGVAEDRLRIGGRRRSVPAS